MTNDYFENSVIVQIDNIVNRGMNGFDIEQNKPIFFFLIISNCTGHEVHGSDKVAQQRYCQCFHSIHYLISYQMPMGHTFQSQTRMTKRQKVLGAPASRRQKQWNQHEIYDKKRNKDFLPLRQECLCHFLRVHQRNDICRFFLKIGMGSADRSFRGNRRAGGRSSPRLLILHS